MQNPINKGGQDPTLPTGEESSNQTSEQINQAYEERELAPGPAPITAYIPLPGQWQFMPWIPVQGPWANGLNQQ